MHIQQDIQELNRRSSIFNELAIRYNQLLREEIIEETDSMLYDPNDRSWSYNNEEIQIILYEPPEKKEYSKEEINTNKKRLFKKNKSKTECPICFIKKKKNYKSHCCKVIFCESCVNKWMKMNNTCLICRK